MSINKRTTLNEYCEFQMKERKKKKHCKLQIVSSMLQRDASLGKKTP
jgi:hypothetical protein